MNTTNSSEVGCDIELKNGRICGIRAIGRCSTCERAFCMTHQGRSYDGFHQLVPYVDLCAPCVAVQQAKEAKREGEVRAPSDYFKSGAARTDLLTSGIPPLSIYRVERRWEPQKWFLGGGGRYIEEALPFGRGWILGEFEWYYNQNRSGGGESDNVTKNWLTALLDIPLPPYQDDLAYMDIPYMYNGPLIRVQPHPKGYEYLEYGRNAYLGTSGALPFARAWSEAMQAVKRLTGGTNK